MSMRSGHIASVDLVETAVNMIDAAVAVTTGRLHCVSPQETRCRLVKNDPVAVSYFRFELARQVAVALVMMDPHVIAVFEDQDVPPGDELEPAEASLTEPLRLFIEVEFQTAALRTLIDSLNEALGQTIRDILPVPPRGMIDAIIVDDGNSRLLRARAFGYRPAPLLLASGEDSFTDGSPI